MTVIGDAIQENFDSYILRYCTKTSDGNYECDKDGQKYRIIKIAPNTYESTYSVDEFKLNYKCKKGTVESDSNKCAYSIYNKRLDEVSGVPVIRYDHNFNNINGLFCKGVGIPDSKDSEKFVLKISSKIDENANSLRLGNLDVYIVPENSKVSYNVGIPSEIFVDSKLTRESELDKIVNMWIKKKEEYGIDWSIVSTQQKDKILDAVIAHEIGHMVLAKYSKEKYNTIDYMNGSIEWQSLVKSESVDGWKPPSKYSTVDYAEMFAECYAAVQCDKSERLSPKIHDFVNNATNYCKGVTK